MKLILLAILVGFSAHAAHVLGLNLEAPLRPEVERLTGMTKIDLTEGIVPMPVTRYNPRGWKVSVAYKAPEGRAPIFFLLPGATQDKTSYAALIRDIYDINSKAGFFLIDMYGQGETLEAALPLNQDIPVEANGEMVAYLHKKLRSTFPNNKIMISGVSYGAGVSLNAAYQSEAIRNEMAAGTTRLAVISFGEEAAIVTNQINLQAAMLKLFWPKPDTTIKPFRDWFTRMSVFSQAALAEPIILKRPFPWTLEANFRILAGLGHMNFDELGEILPDRSLDVILSFEDHYLDLPLLRERYLGWDGVHSLMAMTRADHKINRSAPLFLANWLTELATKSQRATQDVFYGDPGSGQVFMAKDCSVFAEYPSQAVMSTEQIWQDNIAAAYRSWFFSFGQFNPVIAWWQLSSYWWWQSYNWAMSEWVGLLTGRINPNDYYFVKQEDIAFIIDQYGKLQWGFLRQISKPGQPDYDTDDSGNLICED